MGWADCGTDSEGRPIGYGFPAICDHPGCETKIDRGLAYACGGTHGADGYSCEKYFCPEHLRCWAPISNLTMRLVCDECEVVWRAEQPDQADAYDNDEPLPPMMTRPGD